MKTEMPSEDMQDTPPIAEILVVVTGVVVPLVIVSGVTGVVVPLVILSGVTVVVVSLVIVSGQQKISLQRKDPSCFVQSQALFVHISITHAFTSSQHPFSLHVEIVWFSLLQSPPSNPYFSEFINSLHLPSPQQKESDKRTLLT